MVRVNREWKRLLNGDVEVEGIEEEVGLVVEETALSIEEAMDAIP